MNKPLFLGASLWAAVTVGCAPAYHCYSGCHVDCKYCPPPPLPYLLYEGCVCHSCAARPYLVGDSTQLDVPQPSGSHESDE